ncbi:phage tail tip lysozyme [uncultured Vagococcus sp.]|uniref:phage tail tip lysozyme n=1 Tax=uncultured Vagococcus sp. TaxID=189676 RepID=UPI0028D0AA5F|nr:phage tail tip lysozyme [uncultured Vagococcus sp.]
MMATQLETATAIWKYLIAKGWSKEAIAGVLGNMQSESGIIADRWESDIVGNMNGGYGLVQWTPATKFINWANSNGLNYRTLDAQLRRIEWEVANNVQWWHPTLTFKQFTQRAVSPEECASLFITYYERPANPNQPNRQTQARAWYEKLKGINKPIPNDRTPHNVITYWYPSETNGGFKLVTEYCKSRGWGYRVVKNDKGQLKIVVGWFHQDSEGKFELEKLLADHNLAYTVKLHGEGDGASSNSSKQDIVTYWYPNEANAGYQKVINFCKIKGWGYRLEKNSKGQIKIIVGWFHVNFSGKIELERFLAANNYNYVVDFFY